MSGAPVDSALVDRVRRRLAATGGAPCASGIAAALRAEGAVLGADRDAVLAGLASEILGAGPLTGLLAEEGVTDVLVNRPGEVWVDRGAGLERAPVRFGTEAAVRRLAQRLAATGGRRLDDAQPWVDARLPDGIRLHAVLPPLAPAGTCLSLRVARRRPFTLAELTAAGTVPADGADLLARLVTCRLPFLVTGGPGAGKTTLLSALLSLAEPADRVVLVEDTGELGPALPHVLRLETRPPNVEGAGEVTLRDLVRQALRMRPDRLVLGEVRGPEVVDLLTALNTGHPGGCGTLHANGAGEVPARVEALGVLAGLPRSAVHSLLAAGGPVLVHLSRVAGVRRVREVAVLARARGGLVTAETAWEWNGAGSGRPSGAWPVLSRRLEAGLQ